MQLHVWQVLCQTSLRNPRQQLRSRRRTQAKYKGAYRERRIDAYDARRETDGDAGKTMQALAEMRSTILTSVSPSDWDVEAIRKILLSDAENETKSSQLKAM